MNDLLKTLAAVFVLILADTVIQTIYDIREEREYERKTKEACGGADRED